MIIYKRAKTIPKLIHNPSISIIITKNIEKIKQKYYILKSTTQCYIEMLDILVLCLILSFLLTFCIICVKLMISEVIWKN